MTFKFKDEDVNQMMYKFLEGGEMPAPEEAPAPEAAGGSPEELIMAACLQALETQDCNLAMQVCQAIMLMMGGGAPQEAPAAPEGAAPVYRKGGRLAYWVRK